MNEHNFFERDRERDTHTQSIVPVGKKAYPNYTKDLAGFINRENAHSRQHLTITQRDTHVQTTRKTDDVRKKSRLSV